MRGVIFMFTLIGITPALAASPATLGTAPAAQVNELQHRGYGTVKALAPQANKITLDHSPIKSLGWPAMTMDFTAQAPDALRGIKVGDRVEFDLAKGTDGKYLITRIARANTK